MNQEHTDSQNHPDWVIAWDDDWQYPNITEKHAFDRIRELPLKLDNIRYLAFPWATYVDQKIKTPEASERLREALKKVSARLSPRDHVITVCQHISMDRIIDEMIEAGVNHVFWTHHVKPAHDKLSHKNISIRPFPLYPVQMIEDPVAGPEAMAVQRPWADRRYLFSFVGSHAPRYYLTQTRNHIIEHLGAHPKGLVVERKQWHYHKIVYEHQIFQNVGPDQELVDEAGSREFREALFQSVFSLCPSGSGPNSIRLWESIGAGAIPVILADTYVPPGDPELWKAAAVFCRETPEALKTLPYRLETIAADPRRLAAMHHAMRRLRLLYGPRSFVHDIQKLMIDLAGYPPRQLPMVQSDLLTKVRRHLTKQSSFSEQESLTLLRACSCELLLNHPNFSLRMSGNTPINRLITTARKTLPENHPAARHFDEALKQAQAQSAKVMGIDKRVKVCLLGPGVHNIPLRRVPFRRLFNNRIHFVEAPHEAHVLAASSERDLLENAQMLGPLMKEHPHIRVVVISEPPLVDVPPNGDPTQKERLFTHSDPPFAWRHLSHDTSRIFHFESIPYPLLTSYDLLPLYQRHLAHWSEMKTGELLEHWRRAPVHAAFFADRHEGKSRGKGDAVTGSTPFGTAVHGTYVAEKVVGGTVLRVGKGWDDDLSWEKVPQKHLGKFVTLDRRTRMVSGYEITHHIHHVSSNIFDALAVGAVPIYFASPEHRVFELVAPECMVNTFGLSSEEAARRISTFEPDTACAEAWLATAARLSRRFSDTPAVAAEQQRVVDACMEELEALLTPNLR